MSEDKSFLKRLLTETWPALDRGNFGTMSAAEEADLGPTAIDNLFRSTANHLGKSALKAVMLPGDVYQGKVSIYDDDGRPNPEVIERAFDLAGLVTLGAGAVPAEANSLRSGIKAYHGSPHDFEKFDLSKIGTGEGAQVYGHGLYFADNEAVARSYRDTLSKADPSRFTTENAKQIAEGSLQAFSNDLPGALADLEASLSKTKRRVSLMGPDAKDSARLQDLQEAINYLKEGPSGGRMYEVNINADPAHFLDWDKPLSQQPSIVQDMARNADLSHLKEGNRTRRQIEMWREGKLPNPESEPNGNVLHSALTDYGMHSQSNAALTNKFQEAGIPGIKYLDQGSRGAGEGSRNYVVFDDKIIDILKKYGLAGASASPLAALMAGQGQGELQQ